jgi:hypothetical protein
VIALVALVCAASDAPPIEVSGYVVPQLAFRYRGAALAPRDRWSFGADQTAIGVIATGAPVAKLSYTAHLVLGAELLDAVTGVDTVDRNGDGGPDDVSASSAEVSGRLIEELTVSFTPVEWLVFRTGQLRIPFTAEGQSPNTSLMFPARSGPNEVFLSGTDLGGLLSVALGGVMSASFGLFNGTGKAPGGGDERGILYALRLDLHYPEPLPFEEADFSRGGLRAGLGAGVLYYPSEVFDASGYAGMHREDWRFAASVRAAFRGLYLQAEALRRQRTDDISSRPEISTGAYLQASFYLPVLGIGVAPLVRFGWVSADEGFDPRTTIWNEAGLAFYVPSESRPDAARIIVQYLREWRVTEGEDAHGAVAQLQLQF